MSSRTSDAEIPLFVKPCLPGLIHPFYGDFHLNHDRVDAVPQASTTDQRAVTEESIEPVLQSNDPESTHKSESTLKNAIVNGDLAKFKQLYVGTSSVELSSQTNMLAILAAAHNQIHILSYLTLNQSYHHQNQHEDEQGWTAIHYAAFLGHDRVIDLLLSRTNHQDLVNIQTHSGYTALMLAALRQHHDTVSLLLKRGASIQPKTVHGETAFSLAVLEPRFGILQQLCEAEQNNTNTIEHMNQIDVVVENQRAKLFPPSTYSSNHLSKRNDPPAFHHLDLLQNWQTSNGNVAPCEAPKQEDLPPEGWFLIDNSWQILPIDNMKDEPVAEEGWIYASSFNAPGHKWTSHPHVNSWVRKRLWMRARRQRVSNNTAAFNNNDQASEYLQSATKCLELSRVTPVIDRIRLEFAIQMLFIGIRTDIPPSQRGHANRLVQELLKRLSNMVDSSSLRQHLNTQEQGTTPRQKTNTYGPLTAPSEPQPWEPDSSSDTCRDCRAPFTFFYRRHHCRWCGRLLCSDCAHNFGSFGQFYSRPSQVNDEEGDKFQNHQEGDRNSKQRYCDACYGYLIIKQLESESRSPTTRTSTTTTTNTSSPTNSTHRTRPPPSHRKTRSNSSMLVCPVCGKTFAEDTQDSTDHIANCLANATTSASGQHLQTRFFYVVSTIENGEVVKKSIEKDDKEDPRMHVNEETVGDNHADGGGQTNVQQGDEQPVSVQEEQECLICMDSFEPGQRVARTNCFCAFHEECLRLWLERSNGCPLHYDPLVVQ